ncbi:LamG-like jellyroll fold domain-containing protein [Planctomycetota bacterium]
MMCKKVIYPVALIFGVLSMVLTGTARAELVGWWRFDEGSGIMASDTSGTGNDGALNGGPQWVAGKVGGALEFDGSNDYVDCGSDPSLNINGQLTVAAWVRTTSTAHAYYVSKGTAWDEIGHYAIGQEYNVPMTFQFEIAGSGGTLELDSNVAINDGEWHHVLGTYDDPVVRVYVDGVVVEENTAAPNRLTGSTVGGLTIGQRGSEIISGTIDEVRIYNHAVTEAEILAAMEGGVGYPYALGPDPKDGALIKNTWINLSWSAGDYAVSHDVYLGDNYDDVSDATPDSDVFRGNQMATYYVAGFPGFAYPEGLVPGTTYYWRIDEVNEADPNSPWRGLVWSFSIPPRTAYNPDPPDGAEFVGPDNVTLSWTPGFGAKLHTVYFGDNFSDVNDATGGVPGAGIPYRPGTLELEKVYYWRVDEFDAIETHKGDIWSFTTPAAVGNPRPAYGATDAGMNAVLSWTPSDSATSHQLYFGTDKEAIRNADINSSEHKGSRALGDESYDPGLLDAGTTYYWRVDEVDSQGNTAKGPLWIFTTGAFLLVDDFESYTDDDAADEAIWQTWIDGFGVADNGAQVGNLQPPYAEQTIVHGGSQSMPLLYVNEAGVTNSEASMTLTTPRDWTQAGVTELSLWFRGGSANAAEPLYAAVSNAAGTPAVVAYDDAATTASSRWTEWRIALQAFADQGINLANVDKIAIGLGSKGGAAAGGTGTLFVDDIRLYQP